MDWGNLSSGIIGALGGSLIGGITSYLAAIHAAKISIAETAKADLEKREAENIERKKMLLHAFLAEVHDNLALAEDIFIGYAKIRYSTDIYEQIRLNINIIPPDAILQAREAYAAAYRFNSLAEYDQQKIQPGIGTLDKSLKAQNERSKVAFFALKDLIEKELSINHS